MVFKNGQNDPKSRQEDKEKTWKRGKRQCDVLLSPTVLRSDDLER